jgi:hypothetical protein
LWWEDNEEVIPTRKLHLNIQTPAKDNGEEETGRRYEFRFLTQAEYQVDSARWFRVGEILDVTAAYSFNKMLKEKGHQDSEFASTALSDLHAAIHTRKTINYYLIQKADMERALNIFVRVNSGGEPLSLSDVLMSTAIANWQEKDARKEIPGLVDQIQSRGFFISKDLILKACLYLYSSDIRYRVSNFSAAQVKPFEDNWDDIQRSVLAVFALVRDFGFNEKTLTSKNALLPIIYWVHHRGLQDSITLQVGLKSERDAIRRWLHTMLLKGIFGTSADTILAAIRRVFTGTEFGNPFVRPELTQFPAMGIAATLQMQGKDPRITDAFIDSLLFTEYEDKQAFSILALLSPQLDYTNGDFHKDHLHPKSKFHKRKLIEAGVEENDVPFYRDSKHWNSILNLRHLDSNENKSKVDTPLATWVSAEARRQKTAVEKFCLDRDLPTNVADLELLKFRRFIDVRQTLLRERMKEALQ